MNNFMVLFYALFLHHVVFTLLISFSPAEMATVELQTNLYFLYFLFFLKKLKFSVSENTVISFRSKKAWDFFFFFL